jgi:hypothetical protein
MMRATRISLLSTIGLLSLLAQSAAEEHNTTVLPEMIIGGSKTSPAAPDKCAGVEPGSSRAFECLNQKLKKQVDRVAPSVNTPPLDARSPDTKIGVVNTPGVQQQYGKNYGVSVVPYRPPPLQFNSPIAPHR